MKYRVYGVYNASKFLGVVEASSADEAKEKADELDGYVSLCHQCADDLDLSDCTPAEFIVEPDEATEEGK